MQPSADYPSEEGQLTQFADGYNYEYYGEQFDPDKKKNLTLPKFPWRINLLAVPKLITPKYTPPVEEWWSVKFVEIDKELQYWNDHLSRPLIRCVQWEKNQFAPLLGAAYTKAMDQVIDKSWKSYYNHYRNQLREQRLKRMLQLRAKRTKRLSKKTIEAQTAKRLEHIQLLAKPKRLWLPARRVREKPRIPIPEMLNDIGELAMPKKRKIIPPRPLPNPVSPAAMTYEITEETLKLVQPFERHRTPPLPPLIPGQVSYGALRAKPSERIQQLATPMVKTAKKDVDEKEDPWVISPTALKYKATQRIKDLAKPLERD